MIARARALTAGLENVAWQLGDALRLPHRDGTFSIVSSRFAFHHCPDPGGVLREMARVCRPGGTVVLVDLLASDDPRKAAAFHRMEILRDPSHVRSLTLAELAALFTAAGLAPPRASFYRLESELDGVLARSFPRLEDVPTIRRLYEESVADDGMGLFTRRDGERIRFAYPVAILAAARPT